MGTREPTNEIEYRPLQFSVAGAVVICVGLLLRVTFGGAVRPAAWWLIAALPAAGALAEFATQRVAWRQVSYLITGVALWVAECALINTVAGSLAPAAHGVITLVAVASTALVGAFGYVWSRRRALQGGEGEPGKASRGRDKNTTLRVGGSLSLLTVAAASSALVKMASTDGKVALAGITAVIFACGGALVVGYMLRALPQTLIYERERGAPVLAKSRFGESKRTRD